MSIRTFLRLYATRFHCIVHYYPRTKMVVIGCGTQQILTTGLLARMILEYNTRIEREVHSA